MINCIDIVSSKWFPSTYILPLKFFTSGLKVTSLLPPPSDLNNLRRSVGVLSCLASRGIPDRGREEGLGYVRASEEQDRIVQGQGQRE